MPFIEYKCGTSRILWCVHCLHCLFHLIKRRFKCLWIWKYNFQLVFSSAQVCLVECYLDRNCCSASRTMRRDRHAMCQWPLYAVFSWRCSCWCEVGSIWRGSFCRICVKLFRWRLTEESNASWWGQAKIGCGGHPEPMVVYGYLENGVTSVCCCKSETYSSHVFNWYWHVCTVR